MTSLASGLMNANDSDVSAVFNIVPNIQKINKPILFGRIKYKNIMNIAKIIIEEDGIIFGGFVRDKIAHDHFATLFYQKANGSIDNYANRKYDPSTVRRLINPKDIDCYFDKKENLDKFIQTLKNNNYIVYNHTVNDMKTYFPHIKAEIGDLSHSKLLVEIPDVYSSLMKKLNNIFPNCMINEVKDLLREQFSEKIKKTKKTIFKIDVIVLNNQDNSKKLEPPFGSLDFECNGLLLNKYGLVLCKELMNSHYMNLDPLKNINKLQSIIHDIINYRAKIVGKFDSTTAFRYKHIISKGYTIYNNVFEQLKINKPLSETNQKEDDLCVMCLENFKTTKNAFKLDCCNGKYHINCICSAVEFPNTGMGATYSCFHCREVTMIGDYSELLTFIKNS